MGRPKKYKSSDLGQLDIHAALKDKELIVESKVDNKEEKTKSLSIFDFINDIRKFKKGNLLNDEKNLSSWNTYMILRGLSMKEEDIPICDTINQYVNNMDKKEAYITMLNLIPKDYNFHPWIKNKKEDLREEIKMVSRYFECSEHESLEYINIMGETWVEKIKYKFGDFHCE